MAPVRVTVASPATGVRQPFEVGPELLELATDRVVELVSHRAAPEAAPPVPGRGCRHCHLLEECDEGLARVGSVGRRMSSEHATPHHPGGPRPQHRTRRTSPTGLTSTTRSVVWSPRCPRAASSATRTAAWCGTSAQYDWVNEGDCPDTVHPSLHRQTQLLTIGGLFEVCERVYQVRSADLANMDVIEGDTGVILVDPLTSPDDGERGARALLLARGRRPVHAVIHTHSHIDHFGGVRGVVTEDDVASGRTQIIAPVGFAEAALAENVLAGNVMTRRGQLHVRPAAAQVPDRAWSAPVSVWASRSPRPRSWCRPSTITEDVQSMVIDGVEFTFMLAPDTEAPAEMLFHLPQFRALCSAEDATHTLHNLYTLRGARTRDAKAWAYYINKAIELFGDDSDVVFAQHHWPTWGHDRVIDFLESQRDAYKYLHDQTLRLANHGETMVEIAEQLEFPAELGDQWCNRSYYGSVNHNAKAVYNFYLGWFDGNPSTLHPLPPVESSVRYVEYMGGADAILERARVDFEAGEYRWVAQVLNHVVFADAAQHRGAGAARRHADPARLPDRERRVAQLLPDRRAGAAHTGCSTSGSSNSVNPDTLAAMPVPMLLDYLAVRLNGPAAAGRHLRIRLELSDPDERLLVELRRSVLHCFAGPPRRRRRGPDAAMTSATFKSIVIGPTAWTRGRRGPCEGHRRPARCSTELLALLDDVHPWFHIVEP